jgi:diguanylate cyclase (GGDEF)-like protein/putative nucleotidyltransferase with HDIG domain
MYFARCADMTVSLPRAGLSFWCKALAKLTRFLQMSGEKKDIGHLPGPAKVYILLLCSAATLVTTYSILQWQPTGMGPFLLYFFCGVLGSNLKVWLPGVTGTLSINYIFVLCAVTDLSLPQTVAIACASGVAQLFWAARKRPRNVQVLFTLASMVLSGALPWTVFHWPLLAHSIAFQLFGGSLVYFLCNTWSVAIIVGLTEGKPVEKVWRDNFFWTAPHYLVGGSLAGLIHFWNRFAGWQSSVLVFPTVYVLYHSYRLYLGRLEEEKRHVAEMADLHLRTIQALALAIDARDGTTASHLRRVQIYARELGRELGLSESERRALDAAALLHDIGKLAVPEHIISKPGKLTPEEFEKMKVHPIVGAEILDSVQFPYPVVPLVRAHHEKWDGNGYPYGLKGEDIPLGARILSAVDCLDALASDRQYRRALPIDQAIRFVVAESGKSFDPRVIAVLKRRYLELEELARHQKNGLSRLSTDAKVEKGQAPAAGFERTCSTRPGADRPGFVKSIAAARAEFQTLLELTNELGNSLRVEDTLALLTSRLQAVIPYHGVAIFTVNGGDHLVTRYASGDDAALFSSLSIPMGEGISGWVTQNNKPIVNGNPSVEPGYLNDPTKFSIHFSAISVPLPGIAGVIGALTLYHREANAFTNDHLRILLAVSSKAGLTIENALRFVHAEETAVTDALTGLPNVRSLFLTLDAALRTSRERNTRLSVLVADMDGFKQVNDRFGHAVGNQVLEHTAQVLREGCREGDYVARMGGDEFVLLFRHVSQSGIEERIAELNELVAGVGRQVCAIEGLRLSVGYARFPDDGSDAEELLAAADARMYEMKRQHKAVENGGSLAQLAQALDRSESVVRRYPVG